MNNPMLENCCWQKWLQQNKHQDVDVQSHLNIITSCLDSYAWLVGLLCLHMQWAMVIPWSYTCLLLTTGIELGHLPSRNEAWDMHQLQFPTFEMEMFPKTHGNVPVIQWTHRKFEVKIGFTKCSGSICKVISQGGETPRPRWSKSFGHITLQHPVINKWLHDSKCDSYNSCFQYVENTALMFETTKTNTLQQLVSIPITQTLQLSA